MAGTVEARRSHGEKSNHVKGMPMHQVDALHFEAQVTEASKRGEPLNEDTINSQISLEPNRCLRLDISCNITCRISTVC